MKRICLLLSSVTLFMAASVCAYTPAETNDFVRGVLFHVVQFYSHDNFPDEGGILVEGPSPDTWEGFLGTSQNGPWTTAERKGAFDWYLSTLGTIDCRALPWMDQKLVRAALGRCSVFNYTNAVPSLRALALNPKGIYRDEAIGLSLKLSPIEDSTTTFVETVMTNVVGIGLLERETACGEYGYRLCLSNPTNANSRAIKDRAVAMFYRNRNVGIAAAHVIDMLLVSNVVNYVTSSNRLETLVNMLSDAELDDISRREFSAITNQLLSSGQPLRWINVGGNE